MGKTIPELSIDAKVLFDALIDIPKGGVIGYIKLTSLISKDVQKQGYGYLATARTKALRENGLVFEAVRGVGLKCLTDEENARSTGTATIRKIRRASSKAIRKLTAIDDFDGLPNDAKVNHNMALSVLGVFRHMTKPKKIEQLEQKITETKAQLPLNKTLEIFR